MVLELGVSVEVIDVAIATGVFEDAVVTFVNVFLVVLPSGKCLGAKYAPSFLVKGPLFHEMLFQSVGIIELYPASGTKNYRDSNIQRNSFLVQSLMVREHLFGCLEFLDRLTNDTMVEELAPAIISLLDGTIFLSVLGNLFH